MRRRPFARPHRPLARGAAALLAAALGGCAATAKAPAGPVAPAASAATPAASSPPPAAADPALVEKNLASFDQVWQTVKDQHYDPALGGLDWDAVRAELRPKVAAARTVAEVREILEAMLGRLRQSHFGIIPGDLGEAANDEASAPAASGAGDVGVELRWIDGAAIVSAVASGSPAAEAGVRPGWRVVRVGDTRVAEVAAKLAAAGGAEGARSLMAAAAVEHRLAGPIGTAVTVELADAADRPVVRELRRVAAAGTTASFGNLPALQVRYAARELDGRIGYLSLSTFFDPATVMPALVADLDRFRRARVRGVVLDLRGNPGGIGGMAMGIGGHFVRRADARLGRMTMRSGPLDFVLNPQPVRFDGPLAILVDERSASTSEILAAGLQDLGRARVFGTVTAGAALPSQVEVLPNGDRFQFAVADYVSAEGTRLEGKGVTPDVVAPLTRADLLAGRDPALDAARAWIAAGGRTPAATSQPLTP